MVSIRTEPINYAWFLDRLRTKQPVTFSRWGDGEWMALNCRQSGANCDGHPYSEPLGKALQAVLRSRPSYVLGMQPLSLRSNRIRTIIEKWVAQEKWGDFVWYNGDLFHEQSIAGNLTPLCQVLQATRVVCMGPKHLRGLNLFEIAEFIEVPDRGAWEARHRLIREALQHLAGQPYTVLSVSAGMTAEVILHELYDRCARHALIDFGSLWDPYVGVRSRSYMRNSRQFKA